MAELFRPVPPPADETATPVRGRLLWFALIAVVSALIVAAVAYVLRFLLG
jgi:hypothetical protein